MTTEPMHAAFLQAVVEAPDEDLPRLVYADWLEDNPPPSADPEWAEFIRLQCEVARREAADPGQDLLGADLPDPELDGLRWRAEQLLAGNRERWSAGLAGLASECRFRRGMVEYVRVEAA